MKVLVDSEGEAFNFSAKDYAISSSSLSERIETLKNFVSRCSIVSEEDYHSLLQSSEALEMNRYFIHFKSGKLVFLTLDLDWRFLNILFTVSNSGDKAQTLSRILEYNDSKALTLSSFRIEIENYQKKIEELRKSFFHQFEFFNIGKLAREFRQREIKTTLSKDKLVLEFKDVKLGNEVEGYIIYDEIVVLIKDFAIEGFVLKFEHFDYSSYWLVPVLLHPYLFVPYGFNSHLEYLPRNNYKAFADALIDSITAYKGGGFVSVKTIVSTFQDLRKLWNANKLQILDRVELSKVILKQKVELE